MINPIGSKLTQLPPPWISRIVAQGGQLGQSNEIRKVLGEPIPQQAALHTLKPEIAAMFASGGVLERIRKKLSKLTKKKGNKIIPAHNTVACVDEENNVYVGVEFLEKFGEDENLLAGILAHEWGHMMSDLPRDGDFSHMTWDQLFELRRDEEAYADGFAGRAVFCMGYKVDAMADFLKKTQKKKDKKIPTLKYHNVATRTAILRESYALCERVSETAQKGFPFKRGRLLADT